MSRMIFLVFSYSFRKVRNTPLFFSAHKRIWQIFGMWTVLNLSNCDLCVLGGDCSCVSVHTSVFKLDLCVQRISVDKNEKDCFCQADKMSRFKYIRSAATSDASVSTMPDFTHMTSFIQ